MKADKTNRFGGKQSSPVQSKAKNQGSEGSILQAYKNETAQLDAEDDDEELLQGKFETAQLTDDEEELIA